MAPTRVDTVWEKHGWWIAEGDVMKPILWVTEFPFNLGMRASSLGKPFGEIQAITNRPQDMVYVTCVPGAVPVKHGLSKKLLLAPIPDNLIQNCAQLRLLKSLQGFWEQISSPVRIARQENVRVVSELSQELVTRTRRIMNEHIRYAALRTTEATTGEPHIAPEEPEETDEVYRALARPTQLDWQPREETRRRQEENRRMSSSQLAASTILPVPRERPSKKTRRHETDISFGSGRGHSGLRLIGRSPRSGGRIGRPGLVASGSHRVASSSTPGSFVNSPGIPLAEETFQDLSNDSQENAMDEAEAPPEVSNLLKLKAPVPTSEEIAKGSIWGNIVFDAHIDRVVAVKNVETNHRVLSQKRVRDVYQHLKDPEYKTRISRLVLRPIKYIVFTSTDNGSEERHEVPFSEIGAAREFERAFLAHGRAHLGGTNFSRISWLTEQIIWEPVDGQHIVAACKLALEERENGTMTEAEYVKTFQQREAQFVVYDDPRFYIDKSVRINAAVWERTHYTTVEEDLRKLRQIWKLYGRPDSSVREDDARRGFALVSAASAVHKLHKMRDNAPTVKKLAKNLEDLTDHAWNPSDECFDAIIRVCQDYEAGILFHSMEDEEKWKEYARKKKLDPNVDVRPTRKLMTQNWLRPLSRIPHGYYLRLVQACAAKPVGEDGRRPRQQYYFNGVNDPIPESNTLKGALDRYQRREAVMNAIRWLMVENNECSPCSMDEFFRIPIKKYFARGSKQITDFGKLLDVATRAAWNAPIRANVSKLADIGHLIPPIIRSHYLNIAAGGLGYNGLSLSMEAPTTASWQWQMRLQKPGQTDTHTPLLIRCRRGLFRADYIQLGKPYLWVIDCRRGGGRHGNGPWEDEQFSRAFVQLGLWMTNIERWNVIFLLPPGVFANEELFRKLKLPEGCSMRRGCWVFDIRSVESYLLHFTENERLKQTVQPMGDVVICMQHPVGTSAAPNYVSSNHPLPLVFQDVWSEVQEPSEVDPLERCPTELSRLVGPFQPRGWGLVACSISTAIPTIFQGEYQGSDIIVIDDSTERTTFLYNELYKNFQGQLLTTEVGETSSVRDSVPQSKEAYGGVTPEDDDDDMVDSLADSVPPSPIGNERVPRTSESEDSLTDSMSTSEDSSTDEDEVHLSPTIHRVPSTQPTVEETLRETSEPPTTDMAHPISHNVGYVASVAEGDASGSQRVETEGGSSDSLAFLVQKRAPKPSMPSHLMSGSETQEMVEITGNDTGHILSSMQGSNVPEDVTAFHGAFSTEREMVLNTTDGYYYNKDGVRHTRHGELGSYTYIEAASIGIGDTETRPIQDQELSAMVGNAIEHVYGGASLEDDESHAVVP